MSRPRQSLGGAPLLGRGSRGEADTPAGRRRAGVQPRRLRMGVDLSVESWPGVTVLPERSVFPSWGPTLVVGCYGLTFSLDQELGGGAPGPPLTLQEPGRRSPGTQSRAAVSWSWAEPGAAMAHVGWACSGAGVLGVAVASRPHQGLACPPAAGPWGREVLWGGGLLSARDSGALSPAVCPWCASPGELSLGPPLADAPRSPPQVLCFPFSHPFCVKLLALVRKRSRNPKTSVETAVQHRGVSSKESMREGVGPAAESTGLGMLVLILPVFLAEQRGPATPCPP